MVNWTAVLVGFLVEVVLGSVGLVVPVLGQLAAAIVGGVVAGYLAGGGVGNGAWHGLLAGALGGLIVALLVGLFGSALLGLGVGPEGAALGLGITAFAVVVWFLLSIPSAIGGAIGAALA
jgi:hypothetical protein